MEEKRRLMTSILGVILITSVHLSRPIFLKYIVDTAVPSGNIRNIVYAVLILGGALAIGGVVSYFQVLMLARMGMNIITKIKKRVFSHIIDQGVSFFDKNQVGFLIARTESDSEQLKVMFTNAAVNILQSLIMLIAIISIIVYEQPRFGIYFIFIVPFLGAFVFAYISYIRSLYKKVREKNSALTGFLTEYVQGVPLLQLYSRKKVAKELLDDFNKAKYKVEKWALFVEYLLFWSFFNFLTETVAVLAVFIYGTNQVFQGSMSLGTMIMFTELFRQFFWPLRSLMMVLSQIQAGFAAADKVFGIIDTEMTVQDNGEESTSPELLKNICFKNISFSYGDEKVLRNINFCIEKGKHIALVGPSGSGKTTTISVLLRFYDILEGDVLIDGRDFRDFSLFAWRKNISLVLQEVYLFPGTIMENLKSFNPDITEEKVFQAARKIGAEEFILGLENGYDTILSERGANLSHGERQLLSYTRAMVKDPKILILDEATSSVDVITERKLQNAMLKLMECRTALIIAHRLSTIRHANQIFVFDNGEIVERGDHKTLIAEKGLYSKLYNIQRAD